MILSPECGPKWVGAEEFKDTGGLADEVVHEDSAFLSLGTQYKPKSIKCTIRVLF